MKLLFLCNQNKNRSKTAEILFKKKFETKSAGLYNKEPVTEKELAWADIILVMEETQRQEIAKRFPKYYLQKRILNLDIPDIYTCNDPQLIKCIEEKVKEYNYILSHS